VVDKAEHAREYKCAGNNRLGGMFFACYDGRDLRIKVKPMAVRCFKPIRPIALIFATAWLVLVQICSSRATCFGPGAHLASNEIGKLNPGTIFLKAEGGTASDAEIVYGVRDVVTADKAALKPGLEALKFARTTLGQAAQACLTTDAGCAAEVQEPLATTPDQTGILAFAAVTDNVPIGATGGGGATTPSLVFYASVLTDSGADNADLCWTDNWSDRRGKCVNGQSMNSVSLAARERVQR
jgi:hypothetical protein